jgi:hypothetical protein
VPAFRHPRRREADLEGLASLARSGGGGESALTAGRVLRGFGESEGVEPEGENDGERDAAHDGANLSKDREKGQSAFRREGGEERTQKVHA